MIAELVEYAESIPMTGREPFRSRPVHWLIELDEKGDLLGFTPTSAANASTKSGLLGERRGKLFLIPANYLLGSPNDSNWQPDFLTGTAGEVFPAGVDGNLIFRLREVVNDRKRYGKKHPERQRLRKLGLWRRMVFRCERESPSNGTIRAIATFIRNPRRLDFHALPISVSGASRERLMDDFRRGNQTLSFRVGGIIAFNDPALTRWWKEVEFPRIHVRETAQFVEVGRDAFQTGMSALTNSSPCVFGNVPFVSFNGAPFRSFGLGDQTARLRLDTVEKAAAALNRLRQHASTSLSLGDETAIFWAVQDRRPVDCSFITLIQSADPLAVADYLNCVWGAGPNKLNEALFHLAILQDGTGRFSVRSWDSGFLRDVDRHLRDYFEAIRLPVGTPVNLKAMARSTIPKTKKDSSTKPSNQTFNAIFAVRLAGYGASIPIT